MEDDGSVATDSPDRVASRRIFCASASFLHHKIHKMASNNGGIKDAVSSA